MKHTIFWPRLSFPFPSFAFHIIGIGNLTKIRFSISPNLINPLLHTTAAAAFFERNLRSIARGDFLPVFCLPWIIQEMFIFRLFFMGFFKRNLGNNRGGGGRGGRGGGSTANANRKRPAAAVGGGSGKFTTNSTKKSKFDGKKKLLDKKRNRRQERDDEEIPSSEGEFDDDSAGEEGLFDDELGGEGSTRPGAHDDEEHGDGGEQQQYEDEQALAYREAKLLLDSVKEPGALAADDDEEEETALADELEMETAAARLRKQEQAKAAKAHRKVADQVRFAVVDNDKDERPQIITTYRPHRLSPVCLCFSSDGQFLVSCSKDGSVVKYDLQKRCRVGQLKQASNKKAKSKTKNKPKTVATAGPDDTAVNNCHHKGPVLCCAISPDDKYLVTGGADRLIKIWDFASLGHVRDFDGHRGPVTSLRFRQQCEALEMFSSSTDRSIMVWNMDELGLMNTLYGHQDAIEQLDILQWPRVLACGGMDKSCRFFKVLEDSHLVFNGFAECISIDCVALINEEHFISGCADGSLYVWSMGRKKPVFVRRRAHGCHSPAVQQSSGPPAPAEATIADNAATEAASNNGNNADGGNDNTVQPVAAELVANRQNGGGEPRWISAVASLPYTDLVATGSSDGFLRLWRLAQDWKALDPVDQFPMPGFINDIRFSPDGQCIACAVGQEHRRGRWWTLKGDQGVQNRIVCVPLRGLALSTQQQPSSLNTQPAKEGQDEEDEAATMEMGEQQQQQQL